MIGRPAAALARIALVPLLVRLGALAAGLAAPLLATPAPLRTAPAVLVAVVLLAALPALAPGGPWATLTLLATAAAWVAATELYDQAAAPVRLVVLAALLYLHHTLTALAATLPYDAAVAPDVPVRWLSRAAAVLAVSGLLAAAVLATLAALPPGGASSWATLAALAALAFALSLPLSIRRS